MVLLSKRLNLVLSDEEEAKLYEICERYSYNMTQALRNLIMDEEIKVPYEIENKEVIDKLCTISNYIKVIVMKDNLSSEDQIVLMEYVNSIKELLK